MAHDIFISYSSKDKVIADAMCANLENSGIRCWIAPRDILPGRNWGESIIEAIHESKMLVLVLSSNSNKSSQIVRELERAVFTGIPIIPFRVEDILPSDSISYFIAGAHWLDALTPPLEEHINSLTKTINILLESSPLQNDETHGFETLDYNPLDYETPDYETSPYKTSEYEGSDTETVKNSNYGHGNYESMPKTEPSTSGKTLRILGIAFGLIFIILFIGTVRSVIYYFYRELYESGTLFAVGELSLLIIGAYLLLSGFVSQKNRFTAIILIIIGIFIFIFLSSFPHVSFFEF